MKKIASKSSAEKEDFIAPARRAFLRVAKSLKLKNSKRHPSERLAQLGCQKMSPTPNFQKKAV